MRSLNRPTAAKLGPPRQRYRKNTLGASSSSSSSSSSSTSSIGGGATDARSSNSSAGGGGRAASAASASSSSSAAASPAPLPPPDGLAPRKKLYISYSDIDVPAKIALTKISRRTKVLVYGKRGIRIRTARRERCNAVAAAARKCIEMFDIESDDIPSFHPTIERGREGGSQRVQTDSRR